MTNCCVKGKVIERQAAKYLQSLGFTSARRGQQHRGGGDSPDIRCEELLHVHIECKGDQRIKLGGKALDDAMEQAASDAMASEQDLYTDGTPSRSIRYFTKPYCVLWRRNRTCWRLSYVCPHLGHRVTCDTDAGIKAALLLLNKQ